VFLSWDRCRSGLDLLMTSCTSDWSIVMVGWTGLSFLGIRNVLLIEKSQVAKSMIVLSLLIRANENEIIGGIFVRKGHQKRYITFFDHS
jgi:hypothetical protein